MWPGQVRVWHGVWQVYAVLPFSMGSIRVTSRSHLGHSTEGGKRLPVRSMHCTARKGLILRDPALLAQLEEWQV